jgi:hypothetical protein
MDLISFLPQSSLKRKRIGEMNETREMNEMEKPSHSPKPNGPSGHQHRDVIDNGNKLVVWFSYRNSSR